MKDKDFRESVKETLLNTSFIDDTVDRILAICKEMLVEGRREPRWSVGKDLNEGWNAYNDSLLKQLGEVGS